MENNDWEKEFDKQFVKKTKGWFGEQLMVPSDVKPFIRKVEAQAHQAGLMEYARNLCEAAALQSVGHLLPDMADYEGVVKALVKAGRQEACEKLRIKQVDDEGLRSTWEAGWNDCIDELNNRIKELNEAGKETK